jgi:OPA family glycerol-3-phosphate transporter-like MFS transporter
VAGILGGVSAGFISDHVFDSRRGPVASVLYAGLLLGAVLLAFTLGSPALGWSAVFMSLCVIGVHGMLSGTASADFGGSRNAGMVTGIIDGFVYLGTALQDQVYGGFGSLLPEKGTTYARDPEHWQAWPLAMVPVAAIGFALSIRLWNARVAPRRAPGRE